MYIEAKLIFQYYVPIIIEHSVVNEYMFFQKNNKSEPYVYSISGIRDIEAYVNANGYPVRPNVLLTGNPNIDNSDAVLTTSDQIGWIDDGPQSDSLRDLEIKDFNEIIQNDDFDIMIEVDDDTDEIVLYEGKCTLMRVDTFDEYEEEYDDDWSDDDFNPHY
tara:strand:- start:162 stop:644 length:483 start_codon:yes stop_codon:yes gene_type:complete